MDTMTKIKSRMWLKHVFFATVVLSTKVSPSRDIPTAATDMRQIWYNPDFIDSLPNEEMVTFVLAHEVMHIILKHGLRTQGRNLRRWNIACDFAINLMLKKSGFVIWPFCCCDEKYDGMSAEQIYDLREKERQKQQADGGKKPQRCKGQMGQGTPDNGYNGDDGDTEPGALDGDIVPVGDLDPEARATLERSIDQLTARAASIARMQGKLPQNIARLVEGILNPPLPWQTLLREFMTQVSYDDESWSRRNRRHQGVYLPARFNQRMGEIVVIGDTSGSIGNAEFAQIGQELAEIAEFIKPERIRVIWADATECSSEQVFEPGDPIELHPTGGGGTDMRLPLSFVEKFDPIVTVLITDGYTPWPTSEPPYPLIVVCSTNAKCPIGQVVRLVP